MVGLRRGEATRCLSKAEVRHQRGLTRQRVTETTGNGPDLRTKPATTDNRTTGARRRAGATLPPGQEATEAGSTGPELRGESDLRHLVGLALLTTTCSSPSVTSTQDHLAPPHHDIMTETTHSVLNMSAAAAGGAADHAAKVQIGVQIGAGPKAVDAAKAGRGARAVIAAQATTWIGAEPRVGVAARLAPAVSQNLDPDPEGGLACAVRAERGVRAGVAVEV